MLKNDTDRDWEWYGAREPYYGVLTEQRFMRAGLDDSAKAEFFASGENYLETLFDPIARHATPLSPDARVLDFGCGVGRLVIPFARRFREVVGVDVSPSMLREAGANCRAAGVENVQLVQGDDELTRVQGRFDLIHSFIVFQHIPPARGEALTVRLLDLLRPDGVGALHYTYRVDLSPAQRASVWLRSRVPLMRRVANILRRRQPDTAVMEMNEYSLTRLIRILYEAGCHEVCTHATRHGDAHGVQIVFRKRRLPALEPVSPSPSPVPE